MVKKLSDGKLLGQERIKSKCLSLRIFIAIESHEKLILLNICDTKVTVKGYRFGDVWQNDLLFEHWWRHYEFT